jgi:hypothetical protein
MLSSGLRTCKQIQDDGMKLFRDYGVLASNLVELGALACQVDKSFASTFKRPIVSLAKVVSYFLQKKLDKGPVRTSDWSKDLTREQMKCKVFRQCQLDRGDHLIDRRCLERRPLRTDSLQVPQEDRALVNDTAYACTLYGRPGGGAKGKRRRRPSGHFPD